MKLDVTRLVTELDCGLLSGSIMELGDNAGRLTWRNCMAEAAAHPLLTADQIDEARRYFYGSGAWTRDEIDAWPVEEVQGIVVQEAAALIRELEQYTNDGEIDWDEYERDAERGRHSGMIYREQRPDGDRFYFNMTH